MSQLAHWKSWLKTARETWRRILRDRILNRAAEIAFWFLLGFFPMFLAVVSIVSMLTSAHSSQSTLLWYVGKVLPSSASSLISHVLSQTGSAGRTWFALLFAIWSSSSATTGVMQTLNTIYDVQEGRPWWKARLVAIALALALGSTLTLTLVIVVYGPELLFALLPGHASLLVWKIAQWPAAIVLLITALTCFYRFAANVQAKSWKILLPGSLVATAIWVLASALLKLDIRHFGNYDVLYGSLGTLIILMMWFYLGGVAILVGGEVSATLENTT